MLYSHVYAIILQAYYDIEKQLQPIGTPSCPRICTQHIRKYGLHAYLGPKNHAILIGHSLQKVGLITGKNYRTRSCSVPYLCGEGYAGDHAEDKEGDVHGGIVAMQG